MSDPILATTIVDRESSDRRGRPCTVRATFKVFGGLHMITGNGNPYFSLTYSERGPGIDSGGAGHEAILELFPQFADLAALHLSDIDGVPMHSVENGFYWLGGTHWQRPDYAVAARHFRITVDEARALTLALFGDSFSETAGFLSKGEATRAKTRLAQWVDTQRPRWKAEADACRVAHGLKVYGDPWPGAVDDRHLLDGVPAGWRKVPT